MHETTVGNLTGADHHIETILDHIDHSVVKIEIELYLRVLFDKCAEQGREQIEDERDADAKFSARSGRRVGQFRFGRLQFGQDVTAAVEEHIAFRRQPYGARRAMEETNTKLLLQLGNRLADS